MIFYIDDNFEIELFSKNRRILNKYSKKNGDAFYVIKNLWFPSIIYETINDNWNELYASKHSLGKLHLCYTTYCILFHSNNLSWKDVLEIDDITLNIKIDFKFDI